MSEPAQGPYRQAEPATEPATDPARTGAIHDLGYKRYVGTRRATSTRWRVIARHQIATSWKTWWRYKAWVALAVIVTIVIGAVMYLLTDKMVEGFTRGKSITFADMAIVMAIGWYNKGAFILSLTVGVGIISGDIQSGAFTFYFARSTRPIDYLLGKLVGYGVLVATITFVPMLIVAGLRLGLSGSTDELISNLGLVPKALAIGALMTVVYTCVPLGFSALIANKRYALGLWAAYYVIVGLIVTGIGMVTVGWIASIDLAGAITGFAFSVLGFAPPGRHALEISTTAALISIGIQVALSISVIWFQLNNAQKAGVGGAT